MLKTFNKIVQGYQQFREKYVLQDNNTLLKTLAEDGQNPQIMVVSCCDSRVDPALLLQCDPGDLFVVRNVANIVPPYENDGTHHGTSAALEFGVCYLNVKHLIILGHSQCGGIQAALNPSALKQDDFISKWVHIIEQSVENTSNIDACAKHSLLISYQNCLSFPWIKQRVEAETIKVHLWFFEIKEGIIYTFDHENQKFKPFS